MESTTAGTHVNSSWTHGVLSVDEIRVFQACAAVNVRTGGSLQLLSAACRIAGLVTTIHKMFSRRTICDRDDAHPSLKQIENKTKHAR